MRTVTCNVAELEPHPLSIELFGQLEHDRLLDLCADIERRGLQYPPELDTHKRVICGSQRLRALQYLKWDTVDCILHDELKTEEEIREHLVLDNTQRRQLTPAQMYKAGKELERIYALQVQQARQASQKDSATGRFVGGGPPVGTTRERVAGKVGVSGRTYVDLKKVFEEGDEALRDQVERGEVSIHAASKLVKKATSKRRPAKLDPDDSRAAALNFARFERELEKFSQFLKANPSTKYGPYAADVEGLVSKLKTQIEEYLGQNSVGCIQESCKTPGSNRTFRHISRPKLPKM